jgi:glycosyltransferase involved in cell wall biosynthesis
MYLTNFVESLLHHTPHEILLFSPDWFESPFPYDLPRLSDIRLEGVPVQQVGRVLYEQIRYRAVIRRKRPDVFVGLLNSVPLGLNMPSAVFVKSLQYLYVPEAFSLLRRTYLRLMVQFTARQADILIVPTRATGQDLQQKTGISPYKIRVLPEALYARERNVLQTEKGGELRTRVHQLTRGTPFILCVGATYPYKNLNRLILAFARLKERLKSPHILLLIGGEGGVTREALGKIARQAGVEESVVCAGSRPYDEVIAAYNLADIMVMPTLYETFGHPVLEAMACGCPVVTSNSGSVAELAGDAAELVNPLEIESIEAGMYRLLTDEVRRACLVVRGRAQAARFTWEATALGAHKILMELATFRH